MSVTDSVEEFLAYSIRLEEEAALRFGQLADAMISAGNREVGRLFRRLADYSRMHLADARARAGFRALPDLEPDDFEWPDIESPETAAIWAADPMIGREQALQVALAAERAGSASTAMCSTPPKTPRSAPLPRSSPAKKPNTWRSLSAG